MIRRLFTLASLLSLLLCLATVVLWVRSFWIGDALVKAAHRHYSQISSERGGVLYYDQVDPPLFSTDVAAAPAQWSYSRLSKPQRHDTGNDSWLNRIGVSVEWREPVPAMVFSDKPVFQTITRIVIPHWLLGLAFTVLPALSLIRYARRVRERPTDGVCGTCGYNLTANASGVCPECGSTVPPEGKA